MRAPRLSRSGIEYLNLMWSPYSGCLNWKNGVCGGGGQSFNCWAKSITKRFKSHYPNGFEPTFYLEAFLSPLRVKKPSVIGVGWVGDLFGDWNDPGLNLAAVELASSADGETHLLLPDVPLRKAIFATVELCPQHTFLFLTKSGWNLKKWSPFPDNAWVGVSAWDRDSLIAACRHLAGIEAGLKYISLEPLLGEPYVLSSTLSISGIDWLTIGAATHPYRPPEAVWVEDVVYNCLKAGVSVWLKDNLVKALPPTIPFYVPPKEIPAKGKFEMVYRQEMPIWR